MTVVAYSSMHRVMASDSRCSDDKGEMHLTTCQKVFVLRNGALIGTCGDADARDLFSLLEKSTPKRMPSRSQLAELKLDSTAILVFPKGQIFQVTCEFAERGDNSHGEWCGESMPIRDRVVAIGSGKQYAYGVLDTGEHPAVAVRSACKRDLMCALPVRWVRLPKSGARS